MDRNELKRLKSLSLKSKIKETEKYIKQYYEMYNGNVYVSFSGGKDSTVLLKLVRDLYPDVPAFFSDTGLEYPEIKKFVKTFDNVIIYKPKMTFDKVIKKYGYPVISKNVSRKIHDLKHPTPKNITSRNLWLTGLDPNGSEHNYLKLPKKWFYLIDAPFEISEKCCDKLKKEPFKRFEKDWFKKYDVEIKSINGVMASESNYRQLAILRDEINNDRRSSPIVFWNEQDILKYVKQNDIEICSVYGDITIDKNGKYKTELESRTGCMFCMFGVQFDGEPNRFQRMKNTHPNQYKFCMENLGLKEVLNYIDVPYE